MSIRLSTIVGGSLVAVFLLALTGLHLVDFTRSSDEIAAVFSDSPFDPVESTLDYDGRRIHWIRVGNPDKPVIIFVHGSPGTWDNFLDLMANSSLLQKAQLVAFDRPGFGESEPGRVERSLSAQAALVADIIDRVAPDRKAILVGHSYGGPVIAQTAVDHPDKVAALVMIAASVSPQLEAKRWFNHVAEWRLVNWVLPRDLVTSNREILALRSELTRLEPSLNSIGIPVVVVHGERDRLVPFENVIFIRREFGHARISEKTHPDWGHFIPWDQPQVIRDVLLDLLAGPKRPE